MNDPAFLMYSKDWLTGTAEMSHIEKGVYVDLLCYQHQNKGLPPQIEKISRIVGIQVSEFEPIWNELKSKFIPGENGRLFNLKLVTEVARRAKFSRTKTIFGIFGAFVKKNKLDEGLVSYLKKEFDYQEFTETPEANLKAEIEAKLKLLLKQYGTETASGTGTETASGTGTFLEGGMGETFLEPEPKPVKRTNRKQKNQSGPVSLEDWGDREKFDSSIPEGWPTEKRDHYWEALVNYSNKGHKYKDWSLTAKSWAHNDEKKGSTPWEYTPNKSKESPTQTDDITRIIDEFNALTQSDYNAADEAIRGYLAGRLMDGCALQDMLDVIALKAVQWGSGENRKFLKFPTLFKPEKYPGYVQEVKDAKAGKIKVLNPNESRYDRIQRKLDAALGRTQPS